MAAANAAALAAEQTEREFQADINEAVAATEAEIFGEATGAEPADNDGDTSLEAMGQGLEGEVLQGEVLGQDGDNNNDAVLSVSEAETEGASDADGAHSGGRGDGPDPRHAVEEQNATLRMQLATLEARYNDLNAQAQRARQGGSPTEAGRPDMFTHPDAYERWLLERATRDAVNHLQQQQQAERVAHVDQSFARATRGDRGFEFGPAYTALASLDAGNPEHRALVRGICEAPDPARALLDWWDDNGGPQFRERIFAQIAPRMHRGSQGERAQPRYAFRSAQSLPSLNGTTGSNAQRVLDPEMDNNSDASVFDFATRR
jgi:hypothetical protein